LFHHIADVEGRRNKSTPPRGEIQEEGRWKKSTHPLLPLPPPRGEIRKKEDAIIIAII